MSGQRQAAKVFNTASIQRCPQTLLTQRLAHPQMWWHVGQLRPAYLSYLAHVALPENSGQLALWREIASEVMPYITDMGLALLVRSAAIACHHLGMANSGLPCHFQGVPADRLCLGGWMW